MPSRRLPMVEDVLGGEYRSFQDACMAFRNSIGQDVHEDSWAEALSAAYEVERSMGTLARMIREALREAED